MDFNFIEQFKNLWKTILVLVIILNSIFISVFIISSSYSLPVEYFLEDTPSLFGFNQFSGFSTTISLLILSTAIGVVLFLLFLDHKLLFNKSELTSLGIMGLMTMFLFMDDVFLLHERVLTGLLQVGERSIYLIYIFVLVAFLFLRKNILTGSTSFLVIAILLFGLSISIDVLADKGLLQDAMVEGASILEEYFKLGGYLFWTTFILLKARSMIFAKLLKS